MENRHGLVGHQTQRGRLHAISGGLIISDDGRSRQSRRPLGERLGHLEFATRKTRRTVGARCKSSIRASLAPNASTYVRRSHRPLLSSVGESPPATRTLAIESLDKCRERGRLGKRHDRLERQGSAMRVVAEGDAADRRPRYSIGDSGTCSSSYVSYVLRRTASSSTTALVRALPRLDSATRPIHRGWRHDSESVEGQPLLPHGRCCRKPSRRAEQPGKRAGPLLRRLWDRLRPK
jgi:hypothetical protein